MSETTYADAREAIENALYKHNIHGDMADIILSHLAKVQPAATVTKPTAPASEMLALTWMALDAAKRNMDDSLARLERMKNRTREANDRLSEAIERARVKLPAPQPAAPVEVTLQLQLAIDRVTRRLEFIERRDGPDADVSVSLRDLVTIRDAALECQRGGRE